MKSNAQEEIIDLSELVRPPTFPSPPPQEDSPAVSQDSSAGGQAVVLEEYLSDLFLLIPPPIRVETLHIFTELHHLLRYLDLIENGISQERELGKTILIFEVVNKRAHSLINAISALAAQVGQSYQTLGETLEGINFALQHELRSVFNGKVLALKSKSPKQSSRSELTRLYGILHNCFQQSTITLAQVFDPQLDGKAIFEDYKIKQEQSVILQRELTILLNKIHRVENEDGILQKVYFINSLKQFQQDTMPFLMHRDWGEFEGFVNEIIQTYEEMGNLDPVFKRFSSYLETLLKHVNLRSVLNDKSVCDVEAVV